VSIKGKQFGELDAMDHVPGAEVLAGANDDAAEGEDEITIATDDEEDSDGDGGDSEGWVDVDNQPDEGKFIKRENTYQVCNIIVSTNKPCL